MGDGFSLIDLKGISKPITKLIESISNGIGTLYEPTGIVRNAKAEAKAMRILAEAKENCDDLTARAIERITYNEVRRQNNIDEIVKGAVHYLPDEVSTDDVDSDWIVNFFALGQDIGNSQMQKIWSRLLAGEVTKPGSFKYRTIQAVKTLDTSDANLFTTLCNFSFTIGDGNIALPNFSHTFYQYIRANGLSAKSETHLKSIGFLDNSVTWYASVRSDDTIPLEYYGKTYLATPRNPKKKKNENGLVDAFVFSEVGKELASIAGGRPDQNYIDILCMSDDLLKLDE